MFGLIEKSSGLLFSSVDLRDFMQSRISLMHQELERIDSNRLLNTSQADLAKYFSDKYTIEPPALLRESWTVSESETQIDVSKDPNRWVSDRSRPCLISGQRIEVEVPINGEVELMYARASHFSTNPPRAIIRGHSLFLIFWVAHNSENRNIRQEIDSTLNTIEQYLDWIKIDLNGFNQNILGTANQEISARRDRILSNQNRIASLGIPLKSRSTAINTYAASEVRRKVVPSLPSAPTTTYEPEPILDSENYNHVLTVIQHMAHVMERSPSAFKGMGEEALRHHFLVQLNGQFEGVATGETFSVNGKTDILLRVNGKNIFIAECKFWKGPKHYRETIDQLLGYTAWRDTKTAIIIFNRSTAMSSVMDGVRAETGSHKNFKRQITWNHDSGFQFVLHHNDDQNRELILTVLIFDVPS